MRSRFFAGFLSNWERSILPTTLSSGDSLPSSAGVVAGCGSGSGSSAGASTGSATGSGAGSGSGSGSGAGASTGSGAGFGSGSGSGSGSATFSGSGSGAGSGFGSSFFLREERVLLRIARVSSGSSSSASSPFLPPFSRISEIFIALSSASWAALRSAPNCFWMAGRYSSDTLAFGFWSTSTPWPRRNSTRSSSPMLNWRIILLILISAIG